VQLPNGGRRASGGFCDHGASLGPGEAHKRSVFAPHTKLQALLTEDPVKGFFHHPGFLQQQGLAQRRLQPFLRFV
jgi:hypothetical protein